MKTPYWKAQPDAVIVTDENKLSYYRTSDVLQVSKPDWQDDRGYTKPGKTVALNLADAPLEMGDLFIRIGQAIKESAGTVE